MRTKNHAFIGVAAVYLLICCGAVVHAFQYSTPIPVSPSQRQLQQFSLQARRTKEQYSEEPRNRSGLLHEEHRTPPQNHPGRNNLTKKLVPQAMSLLLVLQLALSSLAPLPAKASEKLMVGEQYWTIMSEGEKEAKVEANKALMDYAVGTINTMYYDNTGGASFQPKDFYNNWRHWFDSNGKDQLASREGVVDGLSWLTQQLHDPFSKYLTREELKQELSTQSNDGFLGLGAVVEPAAEKAFFGTIRTPVLSEIPPEASSKANPQHWLSASSVSSLPVLTAIAPNSPAERAGLTVGDRIVTIQKDSFMGLTPEANRLKLHHRYEADNYMGKIELTVAKPIYAATALNDRDVIVAFRPQRIRLTASASVSEQQQLHETAKVADSASSITGGNAVVQYRMLSGSTSAMLTSDLNLNVGYIRLTRFSKASTSAFVEAVEKLEAAKADAYIIDLRNNYGGVIQEAMLTASSLLRDPHSVLCYTMNSRGGFTPHDVEEYVVDTRYPGYLLSRESKLVTLQQVLKESPDFVKGNGWSPPSSYASLHEQKAKRGTKVSHQSLVGNEHFVHYQQLAAQKPIILLVNEGTASAAEVFASSLHDNGRTVATIGTKTYGKGLIQHTFPLPDGGGLRLTVAEYLTPSLHHMTNVGSARYDPSTGLWVGGGIQPDVMCDSSHGISADPGSDLCVGSALDVLQEARLLKPSKSQIASSRTLKSTDITAQSKMSNLQVEVSSKPNF